MVHGLAQKRFKRLLKGLIPMGFILSCALVLAGLCVISFWGLPGFVVQKVEQALLEQGLPIKIGNFKLSVWPRACVTVENAYLYAPGTGETVTTPIVVLNLAELDVNWKKLLEGDIALERIVVNGLDATLPADTTEREATESFTLHDMHAELNLRHAGILAITHAHAIVQGIKVKLHGTLPIEPKSVRSGQPLITPQEWTALERELLQAGELMKPIRWQKEAPPELELTFATNIKNGVSVRLDLIVPDLAYRRLHVKNGVLRAELVNGVLTTEQLSFQDAAQGGTFRGHVQSNLNECTIHWNIRSSAPLLSWYLALSKENFLPDSFKWLSDPQFRLTGDARFTKNWAQVLDLACVGECNIGRFNVYDEQFIKASCNFSYKNGDFYITDLRLQHHEGSLFAKLMDVGGNLKLDVQSSLPWHAIVNMAQCVKPELKSLLPPLRIDGRTEWSVKGELEHSNHERWGVKTLYVNVDASHVTYQGVEFDSCRLRGEVHDKFVAVSELKLGYGEQELTLSGSYLAGDVIFVVDSNLPPALLLDLCKPYVSLPEQLQLPESATIWAHGRLDVAEAQDINPSLLRVKINAQNLAWNKVAIKKAIAEVEYRTDQLFVQDCHVEFEHGAFECIANGFWDGELFLMGESNVPLQTIERLLALQDDDFFMQRFKFRNESGLDVAFQGTIGLYDPEKAHNMSGTIHLQQTHYNGVNVKSAQADWRLSTDRLLLSNVKLTTLNREYLNAKKISGGTAETTLTAKSIDFLFKPDTVEVLGLEGSAYPGYVVPMFSKASGRVLKDFTFTRPVTLTGGGLFPMGDDLRLLKGRIRFNASAGRMRYPLLGTTLDLGKAQGTILISPQWIVVDNMSGTIWGGTYTGRISAGIDESDALNGSFVAQAMNLTEIGRSYGKNLDKATVYGAIEFSSKGGKMNTIQAKGEAALVNGDLVEIPLFGFLGEALAKFIPGLGHLINYNLSRADCDFTISKGYVYTNNFVAKGSNLSMEGGGWIRMSDLQVNSDFKLGLRGLPGLITYPVFLLGGGFFQVRGTGPLENVSWHFAPFSGGTPPVPPVR